MADEILCGEPHPDQPGVTCDKVVPCYYFHASRQGGGCSWGEQPEPPKRGVAGRKKLDEMSDRVKSETKTGAPNLHALDEGSRLRDEAIERVATNSSPEFVAAARAGLKIIAGMQDELTSEDVQELINVEAHDNRAWGAIMLWGVKQGWIAKTEPERFIRSRYPRRHKMEIRVWRSLITEHARVSEQADEAASKAAGPPGREGSSPSMGTLVDFG